MFHKIVGLTKYTIQWRWYHTGVLPYGGEGRMTIIKCWSRCPYSGGCTTIKEFYCHIVVKEYHSKNISYPPASNGVHCTQCTKCISVQWSSRKKLLQVTEALMLKDVLEARESDPMPKGVL